MTIVLMKAAQALAGRGLVLLFLLAGFLAEARSQPGSLVVGWGDDSYGQTSVPPGLSNAVAITAGTSHSLAVQNNGTAVVWGDNTYGQTNVPLGLTNVVAIAGGEWHSLALQSNGTVVAWGRNNYGQTNIPPGLTNVVAIAAGAAHSLALQGNGTVVAWGWNGYGQINVPPWLTNVVAIAGGGYQSLALQGNGKVVAWGGNFDGQTNVPTELTNVVAIAAGGYSSLALKNDGVVISWGDNSYGQTNVPAGLSNVVAISAGTTHCLALQRNGKVAGWGYNGYGQTTIPPGLNGVFAIAGGGAFSLAITTWPFILARPPAAISLDAGTDTNLSITVYSGTPISCQWSLNGLPIAGATGTDLLISDFNFTTAGVYSVTVTNQDGWATAACVVRLINSPVVLVDGVDVGGGTVERTNTAQISMSSTFGSGAHIYYTVDGNAPNYLSTPYNGAFQLSRTATIRALAYDPAYLSSAEAAPITVQISPVYLLIATTPGGGSLSFSPTPYSGGNLFVSNTMVTVTATPSNGWSFLSWFGDATCSSPVATLLMNRDMAVEALFGTTVGSNVLGAGQILFSPQIPVYPFGTTVGVTAVPQAGDYLISWAGALSGSNNPNGLVINGANPVLTALFGPLAAGQYALAVVPAGAGSVTVSPYASRYSSGSIVTLTAVPSPAESFTGWGGDASGSQNPLSVTMNQNKTISANFTQHPVLSTAPPLNGMIPQGFRFSLSGELGSSFRVDGSPNLMNWTPLGWITNNFGISQFLDPAALTNTPRFYRAVEQ